MKGFIVWFVDVEYWQVYLAYHTVFLIFPPQQTAPDLPIYLVQFG
ncbi:Uncharacterized protein YR821_0149 [Yersinia ruckeri]|uniref:Uncharacterized protein n=1 Tax=Yersinia ruckeri TaxID=29486 RepID=A0A0A8VEC3_YERRU|nr:hypothetical protein yruck0001_26850 [Yersinia ruckeri ATCC 29473]QTD75081.1 Uncharacterized protein YR821_0149 [Yersinia ruckeri]CEK25976.1 hypothetical protein CSF007_0910 [Yersinia ruckeri]